MLCPNAYCGTDIGGDAPRCPLCGTTIVAPLPLVDDASPRADAEWTLEPGVPAATDGDTASAAATGALPLVEHLPFEFTGAAPEYFRIWVVNLALTIATAGIYSAWAKVRTTRWFYGHTRVGGGGFEYLANPVAILKGRALAVLLFALYWFAADVFVAGTILSLAFSVAFPWMVVRGLAFRAHNSAFRNIRFRFTGAYRSALSAYVVWPTLALVTFGALYPKARCLQQQFVVGHARLGTSRFDLAAGPREFFELYLKFAVFALVGAAFALLAVLLRTFVLGGLALLFLWYAWCDLSASVENLVYNRTSSGPHRLVSTLDAGSLLRLQLLNTAGVLGSLGLLVPWARIRTARYRASRLALATAAGLDGIAAERGGEISAVGSETAELFDVDLGF